MRRIITIIALALTTTMSAATKNDTISFNVSDIKEIIADKYGAELKLRLIVGKDGEKKRVIR